MHLFICIYFLIYKNKSKFPFSTSGSGCCPCEDCWACHMVSSDSFQRGRAWRGVQRRSIQGGHPPLESPRERIIKGIQEPSIEFQQFFCSPLKNIFIFWDWTYLLKSMMFFSCLSKSQVMLLLFQGGSKGPQTNACLGAVLPMQSAPKLSYVFMLFDQGEKPPLGLWQLSLLKVLWSLHGPSRIQLPRTYGLQEHWSKCGLAPHRNWWCILSDIGCPFIVTMVANGRVQFRLYSLWLDA